MVELNEKALEAAAISLSGAPFPSKRSIRKAEVAITAYLAALPAGLVERLIEIIGAIQSDCSHGSRISKLCNEAFDLLSSDTAALSAGARVKITEKARTAFYEATEITREGSVRNLDAGLSAAISALSDAPVVTEDDVAATLWRTEVIDAGVPPSVIARRTRDAFENESDSTKDKWRKYAKAAIAAQEGGK